MTQYWNETVFVIVYSKGGYVNQKVVYTEQDAELVQAQLVGLGYQILHVEETR